MEYASLETFNRQDTDSCATEVRMLFLNPMHAGKVIVIVEGPDDKDVYEPFFLVNAVSFYPIGGCTKLTQTLQALNGTYEQRLLAIKDADFDRINKSIPPFPNLFLTDTHDLEGMILKNGIPQNLDENDQKRCKDIDVQALKKALADISYMKWHNYTDGLELKFENISPCQPFDTYFNQVLTLSKKKPPYRKDDFEAFRNTHPNADLDELTNGHDLFEKIYKEAKAKNNSNFAKKTFFSNLRKSYTEKDFATTQLHQVLKAYERQLGTQLVC